MEVNSNAKHSLHDREPNMDPTAYSLARFWDVSDDAIFTCPYDATHKIRRFRMERHLVLCKKNHPEARVATCPYNATHVLPVKFFVHHIAGCPDIRLVDPDQGMVRSESSRARMFKTCIGSGQAVNLFAKPFMKSSAPSQRLACLAEADDQESNACPAVAVTCANFDQHVSIPAQKMTFPTFQDKESLKDVMRANFKNFESSGRTFVENDVIAGGAPAAQSLYSCGGVAPAEGDDDIKFDQHLEDMERPSVKPTSVPPLTTQQRVTARSQRFAAQRRSESIISATNSATSIQTV